MTYFSTGAGTAYTAGAGAACSSTGAGAACTAGAGAKKFSSGETTGRWWGASVSPDLTTQ